MPQINFFIKPEQIEHFKEFIDELRFHIPTSNETFILKDLGESLERANWKYPSFFHALIEGESAIATIYENKFGYCIYCVNSANDRCFLVKDRDTFIFESTSLNQVDEFIENELNTATDSLTASINI